MSAIVWQPLVVYAYLCIPRAALVMIVPSAELQLTHGFLDQTLAYVGVILCLYHLFRLAPPRARHALISALIVWLHVDFVIRCGEAALMYQFDIGYSSLFFYHLQWASVRLALAQYPAAVIPVCATVAAAHWLLRRVLPDGPGWSNLTLLNRAAAIFMVLFGLRCAYVLERERHRATEDFAVASLALNLQSYLNERGEFQNVNLTQRERIYLRTLGIGPGRLRLPAIHPVKPKDPLNLITVYLEGFQANFTSAGGGVYPGLTPNLDRFTSRALYMSNFFNAVTPTINSLISSQCGILSQVESDSLGVDRGYTRNLQCLSDVLHDAGYHQEFLGGADSGFSGKRLFLKAHQFDDVWGWERWGENEMYSSESRRNAWGLNDTDLVRETIARLPALAAHAPFHLSLLTVNTHQPGYQAADCPEYQSERLMLNAIHCTDHAVGMLMDALEQGGYLKNTAVILMGDHMMFPTPENAEALGPAAADWFGRVFMALSWPSGPTPGRLDAPAYTPDLAPIALDVLGFQPLPRFAFGRSSITAPDRRRTLVASHFQILNGTMLPAHPTMDSECPPEMLERTTLNPTVAEISACGRQRIIESVDEELETHFASPRRRNDE